MRAGTKVSLGPIRRAQAAADSTWAIQKLLAGPLRRAGVSSMLGIEMEATPSIDD
jgi:hypothetical protein